MKTVLGAIGLLLLALANVAAAAGPDAPTKLEISGTINTNDVSSGDAKDVACARYDERRTSDLCAQWKAADAARDSATATWAAFWIGTAVNVATVIVVGFTFNETRKSTRAAIAALEAGKALVLPKSASYEVTFTLDANRNLEKASGVGKVLWQNFGERAAVGYGVSIGFVIKESGDAPPSVFKYLNPKPRFNLPAGITDEVSRKNIQETVRKFLFDDKELYLCSRVSYRDPVTDRTTMETVIYKVERPNMGNCRRNAPIKKILELTPIEP